MYTATLYYKFYPIQNPEKFCKEHKDLCRALGLKGRVYISAEGINGTLAGPTEQVQCYQQYVHSIKGFENTAFKDDPCSEIPFVKLTVKTRPEIVSLKSSVPIDPSKESAPHLSPEEWRRTLESEKDFVLLDVRNDYESRIGHFEGAVCPDVENFFDFEQWLDGAQLEQDKKVLMYCTGGIRCEKFSILMQKKGFKNVFQLDGGIINYSQKENGAHYKGKCFVFDDRLAIPVEADQKEPLGRCEITGVPCDRYLNCANSECNKLFLCSEEGAKTYEGCCGETCMHARTRRPFDPKDIYSPTRKWYVYRSKNTDVIPVETGLKPVSTKG